MVAKKSRGVLARRDTKATKGSRTLFIAVVLFVVAAMVFSCIAGTIGLIMMSNPTVRDQIGVQATRGRETEESWRGRLQNIGYIVNLMLQSIQLDKEYDSLPNLLVLNETLSPEEMDTSPTYWQMYTNSKESAQLLLEIIPFISAENIIHTDKIPAVEGFGEFGYPGAFSILGKTFCLQEWEVYNYNYINPYSYMYGREDLLTTMVHETIHLEGVCNSNPRMEEAVQVSTIEVLASMAMHGNKYAVKPLLRELRDFRTAQLKVHLQEEGFDPAIYNLFMKTFIVTTPKERVMLDWGDLFWAGREEERMDIIDRYYKSPMDDIDQALATPTLLTPPLPLGNVYDDNTLTRVDMTKLQYFLQHIDLMLALGNGK